MNRSSSIDLLYPHGLSSAFSFIISNDFDMTGQPVSLEVSDLEGNHFFEIDDSNAQITITDQTIIVDITPGSIEGAMVQEDLEYQFGITIGAGSLGFRLQGTWRATRSYGRLMVPDIKEFQVVVENDVVEVTAPSSDFIVATVIKTKLYIDVGTGGDFELLDDALAWAEASIFSSGGSVQFNLTGATHYVGKNNASYSFSNAKISFLGTGYSFTEIKPHADAILSTYILFTLNNAIFHFEKMEITLSLLGFIEATKSLISILSVKLSTASTYAISINASTLSVHTSILSLLGNFILSNYSVFSITSSTFDGIDKLKTLFTLNYSSNLTLRDNTFANFNYIYWVLGSSSVNSENSAISNYNFIANIDLNITSVDNSFISTTLAPIIQFLSSGATINRPTANAATGTMYFDTDYLIPVWFDGGVWRDATGALA